MENKTTSGMSFFVIALCAMAAGLWYYWPGKPRQHFGSMNLPTVVHATGR